MNMCASKKNKEKVGQQNQEPGQEASQAQMISSQNSNSLGKRTFPKMSFWRKELCTSAQRGKALTFLSDHWRGTGNHV